jgi:hypothetical protein
MRRLWIWVWGGLLIACGARSTERHAPPDKQGTTDMANAELEEFHTCDVLVAFFPVVIAGSRYTVAFEYDEGATETTMSVFGPDRDDHLRPLRSVTEPGIGIHDADGRLVDGDLWFATEGNSSDAVQWTRSASSEVIDPDQPPRFELVWMGGLSPADAGRVDVPPTELWNVTTLPPNQWLFGPRFVGGAAAAPELVVNTADGQVALLRPSTQASDAVGEARFVTVPSADAPKGTLSPITGAFAPRACMVGDALVVSLLRPGGPVYPFKLVERSRAGVPPSGAALCVVEDGKQEHDLSAKLDLGPVIEHALAPGNDGSLWLFALRDADVGTEILALQRRGPGAWVVRGQKRFTRDLWRVSALAGGSDLWHLVLGEKVDAGWALHELRWKL